MYKYLLVTCVFLVSSCATMSKDECLHAKWDDIGRKDGANGLELTRFNTYSKDCEKSGAPADQAAYEAGRNQGLRSFCTVTNGYGEGERGNGYRGVCLNINESEFLKGYKLGSELHVYSADLAAAQSKLAQTNKEIDTLQSEIKSLESDMEAKDISYQDRKTKRDLIDVKLRQIDSDRDMLGRLEFNVDQKKRAYDSMKKTHLNMGFCSSPECFKQ